MAVGMLFIAVRAARTARGLTGAFVHDDRVAGLRLTAPTHDWVILIADDCATGPGACWGLMNHETGAGIYLKKQAPFRDSTEGRTPEEIMRTVRTGIMDEQAKDPGKVTWVSEGEVILDGGAALFSWDVSHPDAGRYSFHAASVRSPADPEMELLFLAGSEDRYKDRTGKDFRRFLGSLAPAEPPRPRAD
jgi:hypothetical protein